MKNKMQYLYDQDDFSNAELDELKSSLKNIIAFVGKDWTKNIADYEKNHKPKADKVSKLLGKSLQLIGFLYRVVGSDLNQRTVDSNFIDLIKRKGVEAKELSDSLSKQAVSDYLNTITDKLNQASKLVSMASGFKNLLDLGEVNLNFEPKTFKLHIIDRSIFINSYLISKPQATGINLEFISYILTQKAGSKIEYKNLPQYLADDIKKKTDKRFIKLLSDLNFTGVIRDLYFSEIKDNSLIFHGALVNKKAAMKRNLIIKNIISELDKFGLN